MTRIYLLAAIIWLFVLTPAKISAQKFQQSSTLYSGRDRGGTHNTFLEAYVPDLGNFNFDDKTRSACVTGIWLFYDLPNYNQRGAVMEYGFGQNYCINFKNLAGKVSSLRFAGSPKDYRSDTLTLFVGTYFQGDEEYTYIDLVALRLDKNASSLIVTGVTPWTLYDAPNFKGNAVCVRPPKSNDFAPALVFDIRNIQLSRGTIRSVRRGCHSQRQVFSGQLATGGLAHVPAANKQQANTKTKGGAGVQKFVKKG